MQDHSNHTEELRTTADSPEDEGTFLAMVFCGINLLPLCTLGEAEILTAPTSISLAFLADPAEKETTKKKNLFGLPVTT